MCSDWRWAGKRQVKVPPVDDWQGDTITQRNCLIDAAASNHTAYSMFARFEIFTAVEIQVDVLRERRVVLW